MNTQSYINDTTRFFNQAPIILSLSLQGVMSGTVNVSIKYLSEKRIRLTIPDLTKTTSGPGTSYLILPSIYWPQYYHYDSMIMASDTQYHGGMISISNTDGYITFRRQLKSPADPIVYGSFLTATTYYLYRKEVEYDLV